jgi:cyclopropane fatty-acyl-phospholipid synthase-like methyltransferase/ABC-type nitrate/sulfonate/bicarbonate transport system substrate-binding protein
VKPVALTLPLFPPTPSTHSLGHQPLRVAGVPEHFNVPWHLASERGEFKDAGVDLVWITEKLGTGAMIRHLKEGTADVVIALTEGLIADMVKTGSDIRLLGTYVNSPLCWAISTAGDGGAGGEPAAGGAAKPKKISTVEDLRDGTWGVSRMGSGSHLMSTVLASERGWDVDKLKFEIKGDFKSLRNGVNDGTTDAFMWETFTTKPFHDSGEVNRVGDISTPWPCFMLAARSSVVDERLEDIQRMLAVIQKAAQDFHESPHSIQEVVNRTGIKQEDATAWMSTVEISANRFISEAAVERVFDALRRTGALEPEREIHASSVIDVRLAELRQDIKAMRLYRKPELLTALYRQLAANKLSKGPVEYTDLCKFDLNLYNGSAALDTVIDHLGISAEHRVMNIGSGVGGVARYLAGKTKCQVLACELQNDLHSTASELTVRSNMKSNVHHVCGDFSEMAKHFQLSSYDSIVSWLTVLHFQDKAELFRSCYSLLRPGGKLFIADFFERAKLTDGEWTVLKEEVAVKGLFASIGVYVTALKAAGFQVTVAADVTEQWTTFTSGRHTSFVAKKTEHVASLGNDVYDGLENFYSTIKELYDGGNLGGVEITAIKPLGW